MIFPDTSCGKISSKLTETVALKITVFNVGDNCLRGTGSMTSLKIESY